MKELFFPNRCAMCGRVIDPPTCICPACLASLPRTEEAHQRGNITEELFTMNRSFGQGGAFLFFEKESPIQTLLHAMKYGDYANPHIGYELAKVAAQEFMEYGFFDGMDVIIPVPLHPMRFNERGFNQAEWIGRGLSEITGIPMDLTHLLRTRNNEHQARERGRDRAKNVEKIFEVNHPEEWYRMHLLLVDDIITSGATLQSCMDALSTVRGATISVFALGKTRKGHRITDHTIC